MEDMLKYLLIAIVVGGAIPIFLSYLTRKKNDRNGGPGDNHGR